MDKAVESKVSDLSEQVAGDVGFFLAIDICNLEQLKLLEKNAAATVPLQNEVASLLRLPPPDRFSADFMNAVISRNTLHSVSSPLCLKKTAGKKYGQNRIWFTGPG
jgi:hypothetical protein